MLVGVATGISVADKDLFISLCQTYEQNTVEPPRTASASSHKSLSQPFTFSGLASESILPDESAGMPGRDTLPRQQRIGFSIIRWPNVADDEDFDDWTDFNDWDKRG